MELPEIGPADALQRVRFALSNLRVDNGHFVFEELCLAFARARISSRFRRATGPVATRGDQGMDSETHWSEVLQPLSPTDVGKLVMACTTQVEDVPTKVRSDLAKLGNVDRPLSVFFFTLAAVPVGTRHDLEKWAKDRLDIRLELFDGPALADSFLEEDLRNTAADYLALPWLRQGPATPEDIRESILRARQLVEYQNRAPGFYPETMRPLDLAASMTVTRVHPASKAKEGALDETQLYSTEMLTRRGGLAFNVLREERRAVLLGNPGTGKSTVLIGLAATQAADSKAGPVLFARLRDVARGNDEVVTMDDAIATIARAMDLSMSDARAIATAMRRDSRGLIVLDGLDEVLGGDEINRASKIIGLLSDFPGRVIVSSRIAGYRGLQLRVNEYAVDQLSPLEIESFLDYWYAGRGVEGRARIRVAMEGSEDLRDLMSIPVMAGFAAYVSETDDVPGRTSELYEKYLSLFFQRVWKETYHQREDFIEVGDLIDAAEELAWKMGTTVSTVPEVDDRWIDVVDLGTIRRMISTRRNASRALVQVDGMLTPHRGDVRTPLMHREYRWIHRTMHEHLVGRHLASWLADDFEEAFAYVSRAAQRPKTWLVALEHAFGLVDDDLCDRLAGRFQTLIAEGDPGGNLKRAALELWIRIDANVAISIRDSYLRAFTSYGDDSIATLLAVMEIDSIGQVVDGADRGEFVPSTEVLVAIHDRLLADGPYSHLRTSVIELLAARDPDQAVRRLVEEFQSSRSMYGRGLSEESSRWRVSEDVLEWLYDEAAEAQGVLEAMPFIVLLIHLTGGNDTFERRRVEGPRFLAYTEVLAQQYLGALYEDRPGDGDLWSAMLCGQLGDAVAWVAGIAILPTSRARQYSQLAPWAEAGVHLHELTSTEVQYLAVPQLTVEETRMRLDAIDASIRDADEYGAAIAAVHAAMMRGAHSDLVGLVGVWMRLRGHEFDFQLPAEPVPLFDQLSFAAGRALDAWGWNARWAAISEAWKVSPDGVDLERGNEPLRSALEDSDRPEVASLAVIEWGLATGIPVLSSLPSSAAPSRLLQHVLHAGAWKYIAQSSNFQAAVAMMEQEGSLPYWRPHLLSVMHISG